MAWFAVTTTLGALLLFQVQPLMGKLLLPWFGGTPAVWTTCLVAFQSLLLGGYAYAHVMQHPRLLARSPLWHRGGAVVVAGALLAQIGFWGAPLLPAPGWKPSPGESFPILRLLGLLLISTGMPLLLLASTGPLLQRWFSLVQPGRSPYRLYALSNAGSLVGLLTYPFLIEPWLGLDQQVWLWGLGFLVYLISLWQTARLSTGACRVHPGALEPQTGSPGFPPTSPALDGPDAAPGRIEMLEWLVLSGLGSALLMSITNQLCQEVAAVPLLWVVPLTLYLLSFILCFDGQGWYRRGPYMILLGLLVPLTGVLMFRGLLVSLPVQLGGLFAMLFVGCMVCHGELASLKPAPSFLTKFYLSLSLGGALGGIFVGVLAPASFDLYAELHLCLFVLCAVALRRMWQVRLAWLVKAPVRVTLLLGGLGSSLFALSARDWVPQAFHLGVLGFVAIGLVGWQRVEAVLASFAGPPSPGTFQTISRRAAGADGDAEADPPEPPPGNGTAAQKPPFAVLAGMVFVLLCLGIVLRLHVSLQREQSLVLARNFYGVLRVREEPVAEGGPLSHVLYHGRTSHGFQLVEPARRLEATSYYTADSGIGRLLRDPFVRAEQRPRQMGVIGLGIGSLALYAEQGDRVRFYEINPAVIALAGGEGGLFSFLSASPGQVEVVEGDARLVLEDEMEHTGSRRFDILVVDAFSSDAIPIHLLTLEALRLYLAHLRDARSVLAIQISNRFLDLEPVVRGLAARLELEMVVVDARATRVTARPSTWALLSRTPDALQLARLRESDCRRYSPGEARTDLPVWTDRYSNLVTHITWLGPAERP